MDGNAPRFVSFVKGFGQKPEEVRRASAGPHHGGQILATAGNPPVTMHLGQSCNGLTHLLFI
eukprot:804007-Pyramimonas_sp.AAC.1